MKKISQAEKSLSEILKAMYACPVCGGEMYTTEYPVVACPVCHYSIAELGGKDERNCRNILS